MRYSFGLVLAVLRCTVQDGGHLRIVQQDGTFYGDDSGFGIELIFETVCGP